jgi:hypothetical protein
LKNDDDDDDDDELKITNKRTAKIRNSLPVSNGEQKLKTKPSTNENIRTQK